VQGWRNLEFRQALATPGAQYLPRVRYFEGGFEVIGFKNVVVVYEYQEISGRFLQTSEPGVRQAETILPSVFAARVPRKVDFGRQQFIGGIVDQNEFPSIG
jgi:hypothetical protein